MNGYYANCKRESPFPFSKHSSIGCGGYSRLALYPETVEELQFVVMELRGLGTPFFVVGNMTNVLPPDGESRTTLICTKALGGVEQTSGGVYVYAGTTAARLLAECRRLHLSGAEFLEGIPCTLGGALFMNAGVAGEYIDKLVASVTVLRGDKIVTLPKSDCAYAYKTSAFMTNGDIILGASLLLDGADESEIGERILHYRNRRAHLPKGKSMGCVFKNPEGQIAGKLIEGAGLKGLRIGGAVVSELHANFILNDNGATSEDIKRLIRTVKNAVFAQYKVELQEEIRYLT